METNYTDLELNKKRKRMPEQDVAKGLAMAIVILTHSLTLFAAGGRDTKITGGPTLYLMALLGFIMPFFVFMAGYNYRDKGESYGVTIKKRIGQLFPEFIKFTCVLWVIMGAYMIIRGETDIKQIALSFVAFWIGDPLAAQIGLDASRTFVAQCLGPTWFIKYLITASFIFYAVAPYALKNVKRMLLVNFGLLTISFIFSLLKIELIWGIHDAPAVAAIMLLGAYFGQKKLLNGNESVKWRWINFAVILAVNFGLGIMFPQVGMFTSGRIDMVLGPIEVYITEFTALAGAYILVTLCRPVSRNKFVGRFLQWFGRNSLIILLVHGSIMRVFCDIFNITGQPNKLGLNNICAFVCCLVCTSLVLLAREKIKASR